MVREGEGEGKRSGLPPTHNFWLRHCLQKFKFLASSIVQVSMSSSTRCDAVSVSSQLDIIHC